MSEPILARAVIAQAADAAARDYAHAPKGTPAPVNPYPVGSDAASVWWAAFQRYLRLHSAPDEETSA
jgi:hypothetical protein